MCNICFQPSFLKNKWNFIHPNPMRGLFRQQPHLPRLFRSPGFAPWTPGHPNGESLPFWRRSGTGHGRNEDGVLPSRVPMAHHCSFLFLQVWFIKFKFGVFPNLNVSNSSTQKLRRAIVCSPKTQRLHNSLHTRDIRFGK